MIAGTVIFLALKRRFEMLTTNELRQFSGTENWYKHLSGYFYTDGVLYVAQEGGAFWLIDKILLTTRAKNNLQEFGVWKLEVNEDKSAILVCEDGNYNELYREKIEWTDFPLNKIDLWFENGVLILPSEH
jgi:predicted nucleic-acid-binding Zn-ribbon protein